MPHEIPLWHFNQTLIPKSHLNWEFMKIYYKTKWFDCLFYKNHFQSFLIKVQWSQGECQIQNFLLRVIPSIGIWHYCVHIKICFKYRKHGWICMFILFDLKKYVYIRFHNIKKKKIHVQLIRPRFRFLFPKTLFY